MKCPADTSVIDSHPLPKNVKQEPNEDQSVSDLGLAELDSKLRRLWCPYGWEVQMPDSKGPLAINFEEPNVLFFDCLTNCPQSHGMFDFMMVYI